MSGIKIALWKSESLTLTTDLKPFISRPHVFCISARNVSLRNLQFNLRCSLSEPSYNRV